MNMRVGLGYDIHPFATADSDRPLVLAGLTIANAVGLVGHSDADAVAHAVADAILGAAGLGDLGTLFPASDSHYRDADSMVMLREVVALAAADGWVVGNIDVVINAEVPRLAPHIEAMKSNLVAALRCDAVNLKPKRGEGLGAVGRSEGIAVQAVVMLTT